ncbi:hypothetical protein [Tautonia plasticadhaerens]|uniref:Uncharacterized protein n=1 Tax=Tautonia plasticadhaerens TaxID=2527974 RepID=A0A518H297_9BACT|nr:hypothetical protein [Tautonia plasticadhaerens]QDV34937.1 hypothetical protein ElP_28340 [Tautonia plasticadhaerens]
MTQEEKDRKMGEVVRRAISACLEHNACGELLLGLNTDGYGVVEVKIHICPSRQESVKH